MEDLITDEKKDAGLGIKKRLEIWRKSFFSIWNGIYSDQSNAQDSQGYKKAIFYGLKIIVSMQMASIMWNRKINITSWSNFDFLWIAIEYMRVDVICATFGISNACIIITFSIYLTIFMIIVLLLLVRIFMKRKIKFLLYILEKLLQINEIGNLPFALVLVLTLKYSWQQVSPVEYVEIVSMNLSTSGIMLSIFSMLILVFIGYCRVVFDSICNHSYAKVSIKSKAHSKVELKSLVSNYVSIVLYAFLSSENFIMYRIILFGMHGWICFLYAYYLPYYNFSANILGSLSHFIICISSILMLVAYLANTSLFCILGLITIIPLCIVSWYSALLLRKSKIEKKNIKAIKDIWEFELIIRDSLINYNENNSQNINEEFTKFLISNSCKKYKILLIWEASYSFYSCNKTNASLIQLSSLDYDFQDSFEEQFQEFKLRKKIKLALKTEKNEEYRLVEKLIKLENLKKLDKIACIQLLNCVSHIIENKLSLSDIENEIKLLCNSLDKINYLYTSSILKFHDSSMIIDMYCSFLISFYNNIEKASKYEYKKANILKINESNKFAMLQENNPLFIVSASDSNLGEILYINPPLSDLLKSSDLSIIGHHISECFPNESSLFDNKAFKNFKSNIFNNTTYLNTNYVIKNWRDHIIEVNILAALLGFHKSFFLIICKPLTIVREIALVSKEGLIYKHSQDLRILLDLQYDPKGKNIEFIIGINIKSLSEKCNSHTLNMRKKTIIIEYYKEKIQNKSIRFLHFYNCEKNLKHTLDYTLESINFEKNRELISKDNFNHLKEQELIEEKLTAEEKMSEIYTSSLSSYNPSLHKINILSTQSIRAIKLLKWVLFFSVRII